MEEKVKVKLKFSKLSMLAIFLIIIAGIIFYYEEINVKEQEGAIKTIDVIVTSGYIPENTVIEKDMLAVVKRYDDGAVKPGEIAVRYDEIVGKRTAVPLYKGEQINRNRLIENKSYMNQDIQTQTVIKLTDVDKALKLQEGDYIDIWIQPSAQEKESGAVLEPYKFMDKIKIIKVYDKEFINNSKPGEETNSSGSFVTEYITVQLNDTELKQFYNMSGMNSIIRVSLYGQEKFYDVVSNILKEGDMGE